jgi:hypothetical protein
MILTAGNAIRSRVESEYGVSVVSFPYASYGKGSPSFQEASAMLLKQKLAVVPTASMSLVLAARSAVKTLEKADKSTIVTSHTLVIVDAPTRPAPSAASGSSSSPPSLPEDGSTVLDIDIAIRWIQQEADAARKSGDRKLSSGDLFGGKRICVVSATDHTRIPNSDGLWNWLNHSDVTWLRELKVPEQVHGFVGCPVVNHDVAPADQTMAATEL